MNIIYKLYNGWKEEKLNKLLNQRVNEGTIKNYSHEKQEAYFKDLISLFEISLQKIYTFDERVYRKMSVKEIKEVDIFRHFMESYINSFSFYSTDEEIYTRSDFTERELIWIVAESEDYMELYFIDTKRKIPLVPLTFYPQWEAERMFTVSDFTHGKNIQKGRYILFKKYFNPFEDKYEEAFRNAVAAYFPKWENAMYKQERLLPKG